ncbi:hypothetical protein GCM10027091_45250 [Streptomyces daliensis]
MKRDVTEEDCGKSKYEHAPRSCEFRIDNAGSSPVWEDSSAYGGRIAGPSLNW